jgi:hypothetical protein
VVLSLWIEVQQGWGVECKGGSCAGGGVWGLKTRPMTLTQRMHATTSVITSLCQCCRVQQHRLPGVEVLLQHCVATVVQGRGIGSLLGEDPLTQAAHIMPTHHPPLHMHTMDMAKALAAAEHGVGFPWARGQPCSDAASMGQRGRLDPSPTTAARPLVMLCV